MRILKNLNTQEIKKYLANRYPYLLIDAATEIEVGVRAKGYKNLTANEWFFPVHFPEEPIMPGMLQMEALLQMLSLTVLTMDGNAQKSVRGRSGTQIKLKKRVVPGDRLDIEATLTSFENNIAVGEAKGFVGAEEVCSGKFVFTVVNAAEYKESLNET